MYTMNEAIKNLEPQAVWKNFTNLNAVPRPSKKEERVIAFMQDFGKKLNLETLTDKAGNVIIKKPATKGFEDRKTVVLQSHLDMVHQKNNETNFDFDSQGIEMHVDGDWVRAKGTTLGADNGLGVATIMAILEAKDMEHPAIEALFTIDEETGMTGAKNLDPTILEGEILLNLDTEEDDEIGIGCAGGVDLTASKTYKQEEVPSKAIAYQITVNGLNGGHSGMDIIKGLGNANKIMNRILFLGHTEFGLRIHSVHGGGLRNAIPRESKSIVVIDHVNEPNFLKAARSLTEEIRQEFSVLEPNLNIDFKTEKLPELVMNQKDQETFIKAIEAAHNGVYRMSPSIEGLVETSNNVAKVVAEDGEIEVLCLTRSSVESTKVSLANSLSSVFELADFNVKLSGDYPGWEPNPNSEIVQVLDKIYQQQNDEKARIAACHAGLECGILGSHYPKMDMVSFGPTIRGAHSPDERASISSTQKFWKLTQEVLKQIPKR
ncbi:aminoacyl-histidine dipeptidase [Psychroflexus planctonicus]|uniref:Aminoacyl-histidine dipeptidase n=2 Tax=Psychroflexus planctonicus TaxID=1526575 RepID=A0ABQ1SDS6_9FLAO|nr:aminoacyl-histidine dipeptidase [Psychroflexus planctonicus]